MIISDLEKGDLSDDEAVWRAYNSVCPDEIFEERGVELISNDCGDGIGINNSPRRSNGWVSAKSPVEIN